MYGMNEMDKAQRESVREREGNVYGMVYKWKVSESGEVGICLRLHAAPICVLSKLFCIVVVVYMYALLSIVIHIRLNIFVNL